MDENILSNIGQEQPPTEVLQPQLLETDSTPDSRRNYFEIGKRAVESAIIFVSVFPPTNEGIRFGGATAVFVATKSPELSATYMAFSTFTLEGGGAVATADVLSGKSGNKFTNQFNDKLEKMHIKRDLKPNGAIKAGVSLTLGSAVATFLVHREDITRKRSQDILYGLYNASAVSAVLTAETYLVAKGIVDLEPKTIAMAVIAIGGGFAGIQSLRRKIKGEKTEEEMTPQLDIVANLAEKTNE